MKTQANLLFLALLTSCAKLADGAGDRSSSPATPEVRRLASEPIAVLRERVTSKGGTTAAALAVMNERQLGAHIGDAVAAACRPA